MDERIVEKVLARDESDGDSEKAEWTLRNFIEIEETSSSFGLLYDITFYVILYVTAVAYALQQYGVETNTIPFLSASVAITLFVIWGLFRSELARRYHKILVGSGWVIMLIGIGVLAAPQRVADVAQPVASIPGYRFIHLFVVLLFLRKIVGNIYGHYRSGAPTIDTSYIKVFKEGWKDGKRK